MLTFDKITTPGVEFPLQAYRFLHHGDEIEGYDVADCPVDYAQWEWEREISKATDALWDKYGTLCRGSDGQLYGVEYAYVVDAKTNTGSFVPAAWARVEKVEEVANHD